MKRLFYSVFVTLLFSLSAFAQTEGINFQGLARNAAGEVLVSQQISLRLSVLLGSESGAVAYVETRLATTNPQGIFSLVIGDGNAISKTGDFSSIDWGTAAKFIKVEMDPNAGNNFLMMGTTRMQAVPFAFYAYGVDAENVKGILPLGSGGTGVASISELKKSLAVDQINNTSDASKPISTATQAALATKANTADVTTSLATKVDKVTGKELSTNDYTTAEKTKLAAITGTNTGDQDLSGYATTSQLATKSNTADVTSSLDTKVDKVTGQGLSTNDYTTEEKTKLAAVTGTNTGDQDLSGYATTSQLATKSNTTDVTTSLDTKVDKVTGQGLSTNDYTTAEKTKLAAITGTNTGDQDLSGYATTSDVTTSLATKVDKVTGKELSTNDYTTAEKTKLAAITGTNTGDQDLSALATNTALALKANTADVTTSLATKANTADVTTSLATKVDKVTGKELSTNDYTTAEKTKLASIRGTNTGDQDLSGFATTTQLATKANSSDVTTGLATKANATDVTTSLATKVDKVTGKELSTNDYTTAEKTKLAAITGTNTGDQVNITGNAATATLADNISATTNTTLTSLANLATVGTLTSGTISLTTDIATNGNLKAGTVTYPNTHGTSGQVLSTTGSGTLSWTSIPIPDLTNYVTTNTEQTITASKTFSETTTFSKDALINGLTVGRGGGNKAYNTAIGTAALESNSTGSSNTAIGFGALSTNVTGEFNTAIGYLADVGYDNLTNATAIGYGAVALGDNTIQLGNTDVTDVKTSGNLTVNGITVGRGSGNQSGNTAVGISALSNNSDGDGNTASGSSALFNNTEGSGNTASGWRALYLNTTGNNNTVSGSQALLFNADGISNTAIGYRAGRKIADDSGNNTTSDYSVYLGSETKASADGAENEIVIGYNAIGAGSHTIQLGNTAVTNVNTSGAITAGGKIIAGASSAASSSAVLEANSTTQGFLPPRLTTTQRDAIATPAEGLTLWNTTNKQLEVFDGSIWVNMNGELVSTLTVGQSYGGGVVAYIFTVNDPGYVANEQHGLIAATSDQSTGIPWSEGGFSNPQTISTGARGTAIGTGLSNTNTIIGAVGPSTSYAVGLARAHNGGGYTDWYLPSKDELYKLYLNRSAIGGFSGTYWSSTEYDQYDARFLEFGIGTQDYNTKHLNSFKVRAVRTF